MDIKESISKLNGESVSHAFPPRRSGLSHLCHRNVSIVPNSLLILLEFPQLQVVLHVDQDEVADEANGEEPAARAHGVEDDLHPVEFGLTANSWYGRPFVRLRVDERDEVVDLLASAVELVSIQAVSGGVSDGW